MNGSWNSCFGDAECNTDLARNTNLTFIHFTYLVRIISWEQI